MQPAATFTFRAKAGKYAGQNRKQKCKHPRGKNWRSIIRIRPRLKKWQCRQERSKQLPAPPSHFFPLTPSLLSFAHVVHNCWFPFGHSNSIQSAHPPTPSHSLPFTHTPFTGGLPSALYIPVSLPGLLLSVCPSNESRATEFLHSDVLVLHKPCLQNEAFGGGVFVAELRKRWQVSGRRSVSAAPLNFNSSTLSSVGTIKSVPLCTCRNQNSSSNKSNKFISSVSC